MNHLGSDNVAGNLQQPQEVSDGIGANHEKRLSKFALLNTVEERAEKVTTETPSEKMEMIETSAYSASECEISKQGIRK